MQTRPDLPLLRRLFFPPPSLFLFLSSSLFRRAHLPSPCAHSLSLLYLLYLFAVLSRLAATADLNNSAQAGILQGPIV